MGTQIALEVIQENVNCLNKLFNNLPKDFNKILDLILNSSGKLIISGMGKSGYIARKVAASFSSTGTSSFYVHPAEASHGDLGIISEDDVVMLISNSGETQELSSIINYCKRFKIPMIAVTMKINSTLAKNSDYLLNIPQFDEASSVDAPTTSTAVALVLCDALMVAVYEAKGFTKDDFKILHPGGKLGAQLKKVSELMHIEDTIPTTSLGENMSNVLITMTKKGFGCAIVVNHKKIEGIITDGDLRRHMGENILSLQAKDVMTKNPYCINENMLAANALKIMNSKNITSLIVVDKNNELIGILHMHDLLRAGIN